MTQPKEVVLRYVDAFNHGDLEALRAVFANDALVWGCLVGGRLSRLGQFGEIL